MAFKDLGDWAELVGLRLPIGGRVYLLPPISAELGPRVQALIDFGIDVAFGGDTDDGAQVLDDVAERDLYKEVLGPVYDAMQTDGVPWAALKHAAMTSIIDATRDREEAEMYWARLGKPEPAVKQPADRKPRKATASRTTKASTGGTTRSRKPAAVKAQPGRRSSSSGA